MPDHFVSAHGSRKAGTAQGTFVIPKGLEIHFYTADGTALDNSLAIPLYADLIRSVGAGRIAGSFVKQVKKAYQVVPNYIAHGAAHTGPNADPVFRGYPTGVYTVGRPRPNLAIPAGTTKLLSDIVYARKPHLVGVLHWLCCRVNDDPNRVIRPYPPSSVAAYGAWRD